jgi:hypothetical protein
MILEEEEMFRGKNEIDIHRFKVIGFESNDSKQFLLETYYSKSTRQCLWVMLVSLLFIILAYFL